MVEFKIKYIIYSKDIYLASCKSIHSVLVVQSTLYIQMYVLCYNYWRGYDENIIIKEKKMYFDILNCIRPRILDSYSYIQLDYTIHPCIMASD